MLLFYVFVLFASTHVTISTPLTNNFTLAVMVSFEEFNQILHQIVQPKIEQYLSLTDRNAELTLTMPDLPQLRFTNLTFGDRSINWNKTQVFPSDIDNQTIRFEGLVDYCVCNFTYNYSVLGGRGSMYMEQAFLSLFLKFNVNPSLAGIGMNISITGDPIFSYKNLTFNLENQTSITSTVNDIIGKLPGTIIQNTIKGIQFNIPYFINSLLLMDVWKSSQFIESTQLLLSYQARVLDIGWVELQDQGISKPFINVTVLLSMWTNATVS